ncbi:hypothetical protein EV182_000345 [Spiromyces aspiralis]|uniref:Uncharacterized protein n=1 Tax=Spiromyces aspiralis TaxID=68401 RepID=A0ACC1HX71_9FUNG|nr:hypothetical protein EV182_000345 [Spiromyces aspiralis]
MNKVDNERKKLLELLNELKKENEEREENQRQEGQREDERTKIAEFIANSIVDETTENEKEDKVSEGVVVDNNDDNDGIQSENGDEKKEHKETKEGGNERKIEEENKEEKIDYRPDERMRILKRGLNKKEEEMLKKFGRRNFDFPFVTKAAIIAKDIIKNDEDIIYFSKNRKDNRLRIREDGIRDMLREHLNDLELMYEEKHLTEPPLRDIINPSSDKKKNNDNWTPPED